jgi:hypothetical protein
VRFQDAARDGRAVVYAGIQADPLVREAAAVLAEATFDERLLARAVMNGESADPEDWRVAFPTLFGPATEPVTRERAETVLALSLRVAERGEEVRSQYRGAIVEAITEYLVRRRVGPAGAGAVRRERRILFDGVRAEIHPYDVTLELPGAEAAIDCKWGARGINADVLHQLDDAREHAVAEGGRLGTLLVVFDARRSCEARLVGQTAPRAGLRLVTLETLDRLAG